PSSTSPPAFPAPAAAAAPHRPHTATACRHHRFHSIPLSFLHPSPFTARFLACRRSDPFRARPGRAPPGPIRARPRRAPSETSGVRPGRVPPAARVGALTPTYATANLPLRLQIRPTYCRARLHAPSPPKALASRHGWRQEKIWAVTSLPRSGTTALSPATRHMEVKEEIGFAISTSDNHCLPLSAGTSVVLPDPVVPWSPYPLGSWISKVQLQASTQKLRRSLGHQGTTVLQAVDEYFVVRRKKIE
ncbi:unnamed protein product, partial [Urochloa humidicola]